tara:strand:- start:78 stop:1154 length:1077 start_codon:yes stop_codon:yes gene_type:complete
MKKKKKKFLNKNSFKKKKKRISRPSRKIQKKRIKRSTNKKSKKIYKKIKLNNLVKSLIPKFNFDLKELFKRITMPLIKEIENFKKRRDKINKKKIADYEQEKKQKINLRKELLKKEIKEEQVLAKTRAKELKTFLRNEQKVIREKEKEKQRKFLEEVQLEKTLERFRARELEEIKEIEKYSLNIEKEDYKEFQNRIDQVREKYKALRNERLRKRVEELGVVLSDQASVEEIRKKEKEYLEKRELIETSLESFTRSAISLVYQINKRYLPKNADLLRVINLVYEQSEIIIREDQEQNENFLILIYVKDQDEKKEIIVEDKIKNETREYNRNAIFKFGDDLTDSLILYLERMRENFKKAS